MLFYNLAFFLFSNILMKLLAGIILIDHTGELLDQMIMC